MAVKEIYEGAEGEGGGKAARLWTGSGSSFKRRIGELGGKKEKEQKKRGFSYEFEVESKGDSYVGGERGKED